MDNPFLTQESAKGELFRLGTISSYSSSTGALVRFDGESREDYKARQAAIPDIEGVYLDAAHVGKPIVISGYDNVCGVKDTQLAVPSGSCYVFRCETVEAAGALVRHLHLTRKSDFGSQGFGIGVCSIVKPDLS